MNGAVTAVRRWFDANGRELPWRGTSPWGVLVSEVMLQQTPVARVLPVYSAWMHRWPSAPALASATPGEVLTMWGRLGYPRRARDLHRSAAVLTADHGGAVPEDLNALLALPGIGPYSARAVAAFAFGARHGVVDVNVRRVLNRALRGVDTAKPSSSDIALAESILPRGGPAAARASAGLMELGALVCTRLAPRCATCPLERRCAWRGSGYPEGPLQRRAAPYAGSDRQARGALLEVLRCGRRLDARAARRVVPDESQRSRALAGLEADALIVRRGTRWVFPA